MVRFRRQPKALSSTIFEQPDFPPGEDGPRLNDNEGLCETDRIATGDRGGKPLASSRVSEWTGQRITDS